MADSAQEHFDLSDPAPPAPLAGEVALVSYVMNIRQESKEVLAIGGFTLSKLAVKARACIDEYPLGFSSKPALGALVYAALTLSEKGANYQTIALLEVAFDIYRLPQRPSDDASGCEKVVPYYKKGSFV